MLKFDNLEIQKNIEEKRLILGQKIEAFLLKKIGAIKGFLAGILNSKNCAFFGCLAIIAVSILTRSTRDIGHDSAVCLEITKKFLNGGKYYQDFLENNLPLFFYFNTIPLFLAKIFSINPIISLEIVSNLVGIFMLYFSAKILKRSEFCRDRTIFNLIILSFACGFFLRVFTLHFNEFGTKSTYLLAFAFPYISYQLLKDCELKKTDQIIRGFLAAILFCLKPNYGILVIGFEVAKLLEKKSLKSAFCLRNYVTLALLIFYLLFLIEHFPDYIKAIPNLSSSYYGDNFFVIRAIIKLDIFPILVLTYLCFFLVKKAELLRPFFLVIPLFSLIIISEFVGGYDQRFALYSMSLPFLFLVIFLIIKNSYINWHRDGLFLPGILIITQFDHWSLFFLALDLCAFWWIFALVISKKYRTILKEKNLNLDGFLSKIFVPTNFLSWFYFLVITALTITLSSSGKTTWLAWILSAIIFIALLFFQQKLHEKIFLTKELSRLSVCCIFAVIAHFIALHFEGIFNLENSHAYELKSPNYINDQIIKTIKNHTNNEQEIAVITYGIEGSYPIRSYSKKENSAPFINLKTLYNETKKSHKAQVSDHKKYVLSSLKQQIANQKTKLIFVETYSTSVCSTTFLEYYLDDAEFRKVFLENYVFLNRIIEVKTPQKKVSFFGGEDSQLNTTENSRIERDIEVYIRKNDQ